MTQPISGVPASAVTLNPPVNGEDNVQDAMLAGVQQILFEGSFLATTVGPPGVLYATDTRSYKEGLWLLEGVTTVSASNNNTEVEILFTLDAVAAPNPLVDTPGTTGVLGYPTSTIVPLTGGDHTFEVFLSRVSGTGDAEARQSSLVLSWVAPL